LNFASLEFDRVLELVAAFARSERGRAHVRSTVPDFGPGAGALAHRFSSEVGVHVATNGAVGFDGLDGVDLLADDAPVPAQGADLSRLVVLVRRIVEVRGWLAGAGGPELRGRLQALPELEPLLSFCERRLGPAGEVLDTASPHLAQARSARERHRQAIVAALESLGRKSRLEAPFTLRRDRYCLPVPATDRAAVPGLVLDVSSSGATAFVEPFPIVELNNAWAHATAVARAEEERVLAEVASTFHQRRGEILAAAAILAELDATQARIQFGRTCHGHLLEPGAGTEPRLLGARHPLLDPDLAGLREEVLGEPGSTRPVVPLDLTFPPGTRLVLLSGPNAGGKTVALKTAGLAALMAQTGIPVLAEEGSALPRFDRLWCHVGDEQNLLSDLSTFTGAMRATAALLAEADADTLVLYDELGTGTDPEEGAALAAALLEELAGRRCWTVATAHLITVAARLESVPGAVNAAMGYDEATGRPTYRLEIGAPGRSRGLDIAVSCGLPTAVIERAREMLSQAFLAIDGFLDALQHECEQLKCEEERFRSLQGEAERTRLSAQAEAERLAAERERLARRLDDERDRLRARARDQLAKALAELEQARERGEFPGKRRIAALRHAALDLDSPDEPAPVVAAPLVPGMTVRMGGTDAVGTVVRLAGERVEILFGDKRLWVEAGSCEAVAPAPTAGARESVSAFVDPSPSAEVKLIGLDREEAREAVQRFLDQALVAGLTRVRIVHGHGTGALRAMVHEVLSHHPGVARFAHPPQFRGGTGVTEAELQ
jgi:DNA mismatch repair protein MutS2